MKRIATLLVLLPTMLVAACSSGPTEEERAAAEAARAKATKFSRQADVATETAVVCRRHVGGLIRALRNIGSRLNVGLPFAEYSKQVGQISIAYDRMPIGQMDPDCITMAGVKAEKAFNGYTKAYNAWNDCIGDLYCDMDAIDPDLQNNWSKAARQTAEARSALADLDAEAIAAEDRAKQEKRKAKEAEAALDS